MLSISEIFYSIQGEGPLQGNPAIFLRLAGCLEPYCAWCDTDYAHDMRHGHDMTIDQVLDRIERLRIDHKTDLLVITGGEPFLQWTGSEKSGHALGPLVFSLISRGFRIQFETSGRVQIPDLSDFAGAVSEKMIVVCSPKCSKSMECTKGFWDFATINKDRVDYFKFVIFSVSDINPVLDFLIQFPLPKEKIYLMPGGQTAGQILKNQKFVFEMCLRHGFKFSSRMHILVYGANQKGV